MSSPPKSPGEGRHISNRSSNGHRLLQGKAFAREQFALPIQAAGEAAQFPIRRHHAMTRNQHRDWICAACATHGPDRFRLAHGAGDFAVTFSLATGDFSQRVPNLPLKHRAAGQIQRWKFPRRTSCEDIFQRGSGCAMPAADRGRDASPRRPAIVRQKFRTDAPAVRPYLWKIQFRQAVFRIMGDELTVTCENRQFERLRFHPQFNQWLRMKTQMVPNRMTNNMMAKKMKRLRATRFS